MDKNKIRALFLASILTLSLVAVLYGGGYLLISWINSHVDSEPIVSEIEPAGAIYLARVESVTGETDLYSYDIEYPIFAGTASGIDEINTSVATMVDQIRNLFVSNVNEFTSSYSGPDVPGESYLVIETNNHESVGEFQSIELLVSEMYKGAAHPNNYVKTATYDIQTGEINDLSDLISDAQPYQYVSKSARMYFESQAESDSQYPVDTKGDWFMEGTAPRSENFQEFVVTKTGITILFNPYQIAPYAAGVLKAEIPWE